MTMATQQPSLDHLRTILAHTLSPHADQRRAAEKQLSDAQKLPEHSLLVLRIVSSSDAIDAPVRQSAAVHFKNIVKKNWDEESDDISIKIPPNERDLIKTHLVELMCTVPPQIKSQCSEAISLVAAVDFPSKWTNLIPELVSKFNTQDMTVLNGVLQTANSILKRFRFVQRSNDLYKDIIYVLKLLQEPLLQLFQLTGTAVDTVANNAEQLKPRLSALRTMCRIFYSLNYQDLPEYFEDHMGEWMKEFSKYLVYKNPVLEDEDEETEPSPVDLLQAAIVENLNLYASKDEEPFLPHLPNFTGLVWNLLLGVSARPKHDTLATTSIRFLSSLVAKQMHRNLFQEDATLRQIVSKIVVPNLMIREVDEERFEDDPQDFIVGDMEGCDMESRRKCSQELLRAMCRQFEAEVTAICSEHVGTMLKEFTASPAEKWASKDVAIHLILAISIRAESTMGGVTAMNDNVNLMEFFTTHVVPELQDNNHSSRPMVKATALKFVYTFRNQFSKEHIAALMPLLIAHLGSPSVVVHTYSAAAIEKLISVKVEGVGGTRRSKFGRERLKVFFEPLFTGLFNIVDQTDLVENEYAMKCIMRLISISKEDIIPVTQIILEKLKSSLERVAKNPRNPQFNHYMFESVAALVQAVCSSNAEYTTSFEQFLFPPFQTVLQMDVSEFTPYVFQILAQLLEFRPQETGLGQAYEALLPPVLNPTLWERKGNIPALTRLVQAYLKQGAAVIVATGQLVATLGVFQKLVASKANELSAFELLGTIIQKVPQESLKPLMKEVMNILLMRLQQKKSVRYVRLVTQFFALYVGLLGSKAFLDELNCIQPGLGLMILVQIWLPRLQSDTPIRMDAKIQVIGLTKLICDTPDLLADANGQIIWSQALASVVTILNSPDTEIGAGVDDDDCEVEITYDASFSRLVFAGKPSNDPFPGKDASLVLVQSLHRICASQPGKFPPLIHQALQSDPKLLVNLEGLLQKAGLSIV